jgi:tRNA (guanine-N7-)-methyltransferase
MATPPSKRQKREEYRRNLQNQYQAHQSPNVEVAEIKMPQKRFFRQRAHANPFSDHHLE